MAKITWLGEDEEGIAGPSFTTCFDLKFPKGQPVEVNDPDTIKRAERNVFFRVEYDQQGAEPADELKGLSVAELRNLADASGIDHSGLSKAELRDAIKAYDEAA